MEPLGSGGMGEVYRAHDSRLGRDVALKLVPDGLASSPDRLARFEREAKTVASLNHPNIVTLHSIEDADGVRFLTMELVEGRDLSTLVAPGGLPIGQVLDLAIPLAEALVAAHEKRIIHRDLKPANVMMTRDGRIKVLDFGVAKLMEPDPGQEKTRTRWQPLSEAGMVVGTVPYMSPEQIRGEEADARTDLFSLGVLVYELASGRRPFAGHTSADVSSAILRDSPPSLASLRSDIPADLARILERCLEKNPRERFQTALDVANELRALKRALELGGPAPAAAAPDKVASIAVLPFVNRSASAGDEYFSDGLADELLNVLVKIRGFRVAARTSAFHFKGKDPTIAEVGEALHVDTVLEGSVRKAGNRVRISVQLVKVADGYHLWSETYDRTLDDIFAVQDDIAQAVVKELRTTLLGREARTDDAGLARAEVARAARGRGTDPEAHRLRLLARHLIDRSTREDTASAIQYLKDALERDNGFALAWAQLSSAYRVQADREWVPNSEGYAHAREAAERSLALEPDLAEGHAEIGRIRMQHDWNWWGAESSFARALELAPGNATALNGAGLLAMSLGRLDEAIGFCRRAQEQDPLSAGAYHGLATTLHFAGRYAEAEAAYRRALELSPKRFGARAYLSLALLDQGRHDAALTEALQEPFEGFRLWAAAIIHHVSGRKADSDSALSELIAKYAEGGAYQIAEAHAARGEADAAFEWLDRAYAHRDGGLADSNTNPNLQNLHGDPRWDPLMKRMGFRK